MLIRTIIFLTIIKICVCDLNFTKTIESIKYAEKISDQCKTDMINFITGLDPKNPQAWAIQMRDASGHIPSGRLEGNLNSLGNLDECLAIKPTDNTYGIKGKFCTAVVLPVISPAATNADLPTKILKSAFGAIEGVERSYGFWSVCRPHTCNAKDLNKLRIPSDVILKIGQGFIEGLCQTVDSKPDFTSGDWGVIGFLLFILLLIILSTGYDTYLYYKDKDPASQILLTFSFYTNLRKLFSVSKDSNQLSCVSGIKSISMMWIVFGHAFSTLLIMPIPNYKEVLEFMDLKRSMYLFGGTVSVDTFFLLSGMLLVYVYMNSKQMRIIDIPLYYVHRYLRLTPPLAVLLVIHLTLVKHIGNGPLWPIGENLLMDACKDYWYTILLYVQNYVHPTDRCIGQSWYLAVDMQLFIISPLILIPIKKYAKFTLPFVGLLSLTSIGLCFFAGWKYHLLPNYLGGTSKQQEDYLVKYYLTTHTRANVWLIGIILGYFIFQYKSGKLRFKINKWISLVLWIISLAILSVCVFTGHNLLYDDDKVRNTLYITFIRPSWAIALCWVIFACVTGYGGPINAFLSLPIFQILARVTYCMYIVHPTIILLIYTSVKVPHWFNELNEFYQFWSLFMLVLFVSIIWTLSFESPVISIEKYLKMKISKKEKSKEVPKVSIPRANLANMRKWKEGFKKMFN